MLRRAVNDHVLWLIPSPTLKTAPKVWIAGCIECSLPHMQQLVIGCVGANDKVARPIIALVPVDVMYVAPARDGTSERALCDQ